MIFNCIYFSYITYSLVLIMKKIFDPSTTRRHSTERPTVDVDVSRDRTGGGAVT